MLGRPSLIALTSPAPTSASSIAYICCCSIVRARTSDLGAPGSASCTLSWPRQLGCWSTCWLACCCALPASLAPVQCCDVDRAVVVVPAAPGPRPSSNRWPALTLVGRDRQPLRSGTVRSSARQARLGSVAERRTHRPEPRETKGASFLAALQLATESARRRSLLVAELAAPSRSHSTLDVRYRRYSDLDVGKEVEVRALVSFPSLLSPRPAHFHERKADQLTATTGYRRTEGWSKAEQRSAVSTPSRLGSSGAHERKSTAARVGGLACSRRDATLDSVLA